MLFTLLSLVVGVARGQLIFGSQPTGLYRPPALYETPDVYTPPEAPALPSEEKRVIYFERDHLFNKATEPGVCDDICPSGSEVVEVITKPGTCPPPSPGPKRGICKNECKYDSECPSIERCCDSGCAHQCTVPDTHVTCAGTTCAPGTICVEYPYTDARCVDPTPKKDECPHLMKDTLAIGGCDDMCQFDSECYGDAKCCSNGCANKCLMPRKIGCHTFACKVGYKCSEDEQGNPHCNRIRCFQDGEVVDIDCNSCTCIQGFLLCAQEVCPPIKPGFCPRIVKGYKGRCVEECTLDSNCPDERKCCSTGCGDTCQKPVKAIAHPCHTVRFRCGDETQCAATRGLCRPGEPCALSPLCVGNQVPYCESCPPGKVCVLQKRACRGAGVCHRQPICIQLYSDDTIFEENEEVEISIIDKQHGMHFDAKLF